MMRSTFIRVNFVWMKIEAIFNEATFMCAELLLNMAPDNVTLCLLLSFQTLPFKLCVCVHVFWAGCSSYKKTTNFECECVFCVWFYDIGYVTRLNHIVSLWFIVKFQRLWNIIHMLDIYSESANIHRNTFIISRVFPQKSAIHLLNEIYLHYLYTEMCVFYLVLHNLGNKHTKWPRKKG